MNHPERQVECTIPVLPVRDLGRSIRFYTETLGFKLDWGGGDRSIICSVSKDDCHIMLSQSADGRPGVWVWIGLEDDSLFHSIEAGESKSNKSQRIGRGRTK